jgi:hypothetical protein
MYHLVHKILSPIMIFGLLSACSGGGGGDEGGGATVATPGPQQGAYRIWMDVVHYPLISDDWLTSGRSWSTCLNGGPTCFTNWTLMANQPAFATLADCQAGIENAKRNDPEVFDGGSTDRSRGYAFELKCEPPDSLAPTVHRESPEDGSTIYVQRGTRLTQVQAIFSDNMDLSTINSSTFIFEDPAGIPVPGEVDYLIDNRTARFHLDGPLMYETTYTVRVTTSVRDKAGNPMRSDFSWSFTTESEPVAVTPVDPLPPLQITYAPSPDSVCSPVDEAITARFSRSISAGDGIFTLEDSLGTLIDGSARFYPLEAVFTPAQSLNYNAMYTARLTGNMTDSANTIINPSDWSFRTEVPPEGSWTQIATPPANIAPRMNHTAVWTGREMIIWGGQEAGPQLVTDNGRYDPVLDQWNPVSTVDAPLERIHHTATWTGTEMIIWGGITELNSITAKTNTGGRYNPITDTWLPISTVGAPSPRTSHTAVWTGTELIIWGGGVDTGARYNPATNTWLPLTFFNAPSARSGHHAIFDGQKMIIIGGSDQATVTDHAIYDPAMDIWESLPMENSPGEAWSFVWHTNVVSSGTDMYVKSHGLNTNLAIRRFNYQDQQWHDVADACNSVETPYAVWLNGRFMNWSRDFSEGVFYDEQRNAWVSLPASPAPASSVTVVATDNSVIVWGGRETANNQFTNTGYRLSP